MSFCVIYDYTYFQDFQEIDESCTFPTMFNPFTKECTPLLVSLI